MKRAQLVLVDLSDTGSGKLVHYPEAIELGVAGDFAASDGALDRGVDDFQSGNGICLRDYDGQWPLSPFWIWHRDHRGFRNPFRRRHQLFELDGVHPFPSSLDDVLPPVSSDERRDGKAGV